MSTIPAVRPTAEPKPRLTLGAAEKAILIGTAETIAAAADQIALIPDAPRLAGCLLVGKPAARTGVKVLGAIEDLESAVGESGATMAIVSLPAAMADTIHRVRAELRRLGVEERFIPPVADLLAQAPPFSVGLAGPPAPPAGIAIAPPRIDFAQLIGREPHTIDRASVARILTGKRILITGAGGSIGSELARIVAGFDPEQVQLMERSENALFEIDRQIARRFPALSRRALLHDVVDAEQTLRHLVDLRPHVVFHAAAHKHDPLMEDHPAHAVNNNLFGTKAIADAAQAAGADRFVLVSTDKAVNPTSVMGATKRLAELYIQWLHANSRGPSCTQFSMVRFGNVLGSACSVLTIWSAQLAEGGPVTVTHPEMTRFFMTIPEAATLVIQAAALEPADGGAAVHVLDMGEPLRILDLVERFVRAHGFDPRIEGRPAPAGALPPLDIVFTGIRPGEKLYEELAYSAETLRPTGRAGINAWSGAAAPASCAAMIADLSAVRHSRDRDPVLAAIRRHLPEMTGV